MRRVLLLILIGCGGGGPPPEKPVVCDEPAPGQPMTEEMCLCRKGNVQLAMGRAVELHCEPGETELGPVKLGDRDGWCCKAR